MTKRRPARILLVDDHVEMTRLLGDQFRDLGYLPELAASGREALDLARAHLPDVVVTDLRMEGVDGLDVLAGVHRLDPGLPVIIMTAFGSVESAIEAVKRGAYYYLTKPFQFAELRVFVDRAIDERRLREEHRTLCDLEARRDRRRTIAGSSPAMRALLALAERVAPSDVPVLLRGESGTGKELVARRIHQLGPRADHPLVAVNCTALPEALLESELFGHVRGAFTGATVTRRGLFVEADGGSLLLDEIGDMPPPLQARLLRVLENGEVRAVGADVTRTVDVRVIAATHQPLEDRVASGAFRADLFYRLNVLPLFIPPLRERPEDLPVLAELFLAEAREAHPFAQPRSFSRAALERLAAHAWPGNVRELQNVVTRLTLVCPRDVIEPDDLALLGAPAAPGGFAWPQDGARLLPLRAVEEEYIAWVIAQCAGNKTRAAEILGIDVSTIHRRERSAR